MSRSSVRELFESDVGACAGWSQVAVLKSTPEGWIISLALYYDYLQNALLPLDE